MRPSDWFLVDYSTDPTPGDAFGIRGLAAKYADIATIAGEASDGVTRARSSGAASAWIGEAADVFHDKSHRMPGELAKANDSYSMVAEALRSWAESVDDTQAQADRGLQQAREAHADLTSAQAALASAQSSWSTVHAQQLSYQKLQKDYASVPPPANVTMPTPDQLRSAGRSAQQAQSSISSANSRIADANARLEAAKALVHAAKERRDDAERTVVHTISQAEDHAVKPSSVWEAIQDSAAWQTVVQIATVVLTIVSIVAIFVGGPLVWAIILAATILLVVNALLSIAQGKNAWGELALLAVGLIPGGRLLALGGKIVSGIARVGAPGIRIAESIGRVTSTVQRAGAAAKSALTDVLAQSALVAAILRGPGAALERVSTSLAEQAAQHLPSGINIKVWRVFGTETDRVGVPLYEHPSGPFGESWTPHEPLPNPDFRFDSGLPDQNAGRFEVSGTVDFDAISGFRPALPIGDNLGGLPEVLIPNAESVVQVRSIVGLNESWTRDVMDVVRPAGIKSTWDIPDVGWY